MLKKDRSHTWIIGVGYLLITVIVLINYVTHKSEMRAQRLGVAHKTEDTSNVDNLMAQLEEERRVKREMSEMMKNLKVALRLGQQNPDFQVPESLRVGPMMVDENLEIELPGLGFAPSLTPSAENSFIPGKNPYVPFYEHANRWESESGQEPLIRKRLFSDPKIPLPLQGRWLKTVVTQSSNQQ